jgi:hypothetical protein
MKIHLNSKPGMYDVVTYGKNSITCSTKHSTFSVPTDDFKAFAGGSWNHGVSRNDIDLFLSVVNPEQYQLQVQQENEILAIAVRMEMLEESIKNSFTPTIVKDETDYKELYERSEIELDRAKDHLLSVATKVYSQNLTFDHITIDKGIKFIIQQNHDDDSYRFCWDPYGFVPNYHSDINKLYKTIRNYGDWRTINGGWIKVMSGDVILYHKSGDYGVYDDAIAIECAQDVFPNLKIHSFAGRQWDQELDSLFYDLPF